MIPVMALEIGAALAAVLVQAMGGHPTAVDVQEIVDTPVQDIRRTIDLTPVVSAQADRAPAVHTPAPKPAQRPAPNRRGLGHMAVQNRLVDAIRDSGGQLSTNTVRGVAALIGASKSTVHNALGALIAARVVERAGDGLCCGEVRLAARR